MRSGHHLRLDQSPRTWAWTSLGPGPAGPAVGIRAKLDPDSAAMNSYYNQVSVRVRLLKQPSWQDRCYGAWPAPRPTSFLQLATTQQSCTHPLTLPAPSDGAVGQEPWRLTPMLHTHQQHSAHSQQLGSGRAALPGITRDPLQPPTGSRAGQGVAHPPGVCSLPGQPQHTGAQLSDAPAATAHAPRRPRQGERCARLLCLCCCFVERRKHVEDGIRWQNAGLLAAADCLCKTVLGV